MKKTFLFACIIALTASIFTGCGKEKKSSNSEADVNVVTNNATATDPTAENPEAKLTCDSPIWEFGQINEGEIVRHTFSFVNTGNESLVISNCQASCGCTTPKCDKKPVAPGETGEIEIRFDSNGKKNSQTKNITITANTNPPETILTIKGFVTPKSE